jgi:hypothetical protein
MAVHANNIELIRLLLIEYHGANPILKPRPVDEETGQFQRYLRTSDLAIRHGFAEILRMLLEHGAFVGYNIGASVVGVFMTLEPKAVTSLYALLGKQDDSRAAKTLPIVAFCSSTPWKITLPQHSIKPPSSLQSSTLASRLVGYSSSLTLLQRHTCLVQIQAQDLAVCQMLVRDFQADPFLKMTMTTTNNLLLPHSLLLPVFRAPLFLNTFWTFGMSDSPPTMAARTVMVTIRLYVFAAIR